ncbi:MAG: hypothetical protein IPL59_26565 [Candidatus Competibacteraceae bacterium]|nr:hypothetical protein [Candidatus Competibacteraceae bacterium]
MSRGPVPGRRGDLRKQEFRRPNAERDPANALPTAELRRLMPGMAPLDEAQQGH